MDAAMPAASPETQQSAPPGAAERPFTLRWWSATVRLGRQDLDGHLATVRRLVGRAVPCLVPVDGRAERRLLAVDVERGVGDFAAAEQEGQLLTAEVDGDHHARRYDAVVGGCGADLRALQQLGQLADPDLLLALLLLGGVVAAVLAEVALVSGGLDLLGDLGPAVPREVVTLGLQPVVRLLGQPGDVLGGLGHGLS